MGASVRARLLERSRETGDDFQLLLQRYGAERFLYRLGESPYRERFILKGAMLLPLWGDAIYRPTRDLDLAGYGSSLPADIRSAFHDICAVPVADDGLVFDVEALRIEPIRGQDEYDALRIGFKATLDGARVPMQIDIGFGDAVQPPPMDAHYPVLLDAPRPRIRVYPREAVVAEKLHAMVAHGERNSRYKDFFDLHVLAQHFDFAGEHLVRAIGATFEQRRTPISKVLPVALTPRSTPMPATPSGGPAIGTGTIFWLRPLTSTPSATGSDRSSWSRGRRRLAGWSSRGSGPRAVRGGVERGWR